MTETTHSQVRKVAFRVHNGPVVPPDGVIYSTAPQCYCDDDNQSYVVKGPDIGIVAAEAVSYRLACILGIPTPIFAIGSIPDRDGHYFGSKLMDTVIRDPLPFLTGSIGGGKNQRLLYQFSAVHVFDVWMANNDRNLGGFLIEKNKDGHSLIAIDFERSLAVRGPHPFMDTGSLNVKTLRPSGQLMHIRRPWIDNFLDAISRLDDMKIEEAVTDVKQALGEPFSWSDAVVQVLTSRKKKLRDIMREVWA